MKPPSDNKTAGQPPSPPPETERSGSLSHHLDRYEGTLIAILLVLIVAGNLLSQGTRRGKFFPITVEQNANREGLDPIRITGSVEEDAPVSLDLNEATWEDFVSIRGIGPALAAAIVEYRETHDGFSSVEELIQVTGIGPKKLESLRNRFHVENPPGSPVPENPSFDNRNSVRSSGEMTAENTGKEKRIFAGDREVIDLNSATLEELMTIPGIGRVYAERILQKRSELGKFRTWEEVDEVKGIGAKRLENMKKHATIR